MVDKIAETDVRILDQERSNLEEAKRLATENPGQVQRVTIGGVDYDVVDDKSTVIVTEAGKTDGPAK